MSELQLPEFPAVINNSFRFRNPALGIVTVTVRSNARRMTARRRSEIVNITVPPYTSARNLCEFLERIARELPIPDEKPHYTIGQRFDSHGGVAFEIGEQSERPTYITVNASQSTTVVGVGTGVDITSTAATRAITSMLMKAASFHARRLLLPEAAAIAASRGLKPTGWKVSSGLQTLGTCSSDGVISLSAILMFVPPELREYVVCHELAHLEEHNHSPRFHEVCNRLCGGRESELEALMKRFKTGIIKI